MNQKPVGTAVFKLFQQASNLHLTKKMHYSFCQIRTIKV